jgi:threonine dehydrogenase-like Zn-dependent dehydrogenase
MVTEQDVIQSQTVLRPDRFALAGAAGTMKAVVTTGQGGLDVLDYRDVPIPVPGPGEVLLQVLAAGVNNTDVNTRHRGGGGRRRGRRGRCSGGAS